MTNSDKNKRRGGRQPRSPGSAPRRRVRVRGELRQPPDLRKLSRALIELAIAQAEADAQAEDQNRRQAEQERGADDV